MKNIPVLSFIIRYWPLLIASALFVWFTRSGSAFESFGAQIYGPGLTFLALVVGIFGRHLFFDKSADADAANGTFTELWKELPKPLRVVLNVVIVCVFFLGACIIFAAVAHGEIPDQAARWQAAQVNPHSTIALDNLVTRWKRTAAVYQQVQAMKANGVPAVVAFALFYREADNNMACSPAQGDPLTHRSRNVPAGRIPGKTPPFRWTDAAEDAYYVCDRLDLKNWHTIATSLAAVESFNGLGYAKYHPDVPTPYLWSGTTLYSRGKYVADGRFDKLAVDGQLGVAAILKRMQDRGIALPF